MKKTTAIVFAVLAATAYAVNIPVSKVMLTHVGEATMAALLYLGAGIGVGLLSLINRKRRETEQKLDKEDLPYVIGMIALDIVAPVLLMFGLNHGSSSNASLLSNFEIVATTVIALLIFKEAVSKRLWGAITLITLFMSMTMITISPTRSMDIST